MSSGITNIVIGETVLTPVISAYLSEEFEGFFEASFCLKNGGITTKATARCKEMAIAMVLRKYSDQLQAAVYEERAAKHT